MCMGKVVVRCPKCNRTLQVTRPDSSHPYWSLDKPKQEENIANVSEQTLKCKNESCASEFKIYWYDK